MHPLPLVMLGGALGAGARYAHGRWALNALGPTDWPWGTFLVYVLGGLLMGLLAGTLAARGGGEAARTLLGVGLLGGFTTFSAFSLEMVLLAERGQAGLAALYALASVVAAAAALWGGLAAARAFA